MSLRGIWEETVTQGSVTHERPAGAPPWHWSRIGRLLLILPGALLFLTPWLWMVLTAGKASSLIWQLPPVWIPPVYRWQNFLEAWQAGAFATFYANTAMLALCNVVAVLLSSSVAAYAFARLDFPGRRALVWLVLRTMMLPLYYL